MRHAFTFLAIVILVPAAPADEKGKPLTPAEAAKKAGEVCTVAFKVGVIAETDEEPALELYPEERGQGDLLTVTLSRKAVKQLQEKWKKDANGVSIYLKRNTIKATGKVDMAGKKLQIQVDDIKHLTVGVK